MFLTGVGVKHSEFRSRSLETQMYKVHVKASPFTAGDDALNHNLLVHARANGTDEIVL
jgi:hypothetical protein